MTILRPSWRLPSARYRYQLPQLGDELFLTDGGIETTLIYREGVHLKHFAAFDLLKTAAGRETLRNYFRTHASIARDHGVGFILESPTWRASADWGKKLGYSPSGLAIANARAIALLHEIRHEFERENAPIVISGCVGPRGDGYKADQRMSAEAAQKYHAHQIEVFRDTDADMVTAMTMTYTEEAIGIVRAAQAADMPVAISFTTGTDGRLPSGQTLRNAIEQVDAETEAAPAYYMINCAHPLHFADALADGTLWQRRIKGIRANASIKSHAELDQCTELDEGDPQEFGMQYRELRQRLPHINVLGGCCGTDQRHLFSICESCLADQLSVAKAPAGLL